ncbi:MAG: Bug family tripartite tricarboxylate transporter substrate binding protein [Burkholderiales bacterium]
MKPITLFALTAFVCATLPALAQQYPSKPVRIVVPFGPGSPIELSARQLGQRVGESLGQSFVIDNRPGANTILGAEVAVRAAPDGYTLFHPLDTTMTLVPFLYDKLPYDPIKDFTPVGQITQGAYVIATHAKAPYRTLAEMIGYAKTKPGGINVGSSTAFSQLMTVILRQEAGVPITYVAYKGSAQMVQALLAGELDATIDSTASYPGLVKAGKAVALVTTGTARAPQLPDAPTVREAGFPQLEAHGWTAWFVPAGTPDSIVRRLSAEMIKALNDPEYRMRNANAGLAALNPSTPEALGALVKDGIARWGSRVKAAGLKLD